MSDELKLKDYGFDSKWYEALLQRNGESRKYRFQIWIETCLLRSLASSDSR
jgi:hypothetical protein